MAGELLSAVALILALGVGSRIVADRVQVPSVLFLIVAGVAIGPEGLGIVSRATFGGGLSTMVGVAVSIILFEGSFRLRRDRLTETPRDVLRLVTVGAVIMWLGTAAAVRFLLAPGGEAVGWEVALLIGALLIATGPTVITPILEVVTVRDHVSAAMESEGIFNDVTAAILAVVIFEVAVISSFGPRAALFDFAFRLGVGASVGLAVAVVVRTLLTRVDVPGGDATLHSRLIALGAVVGAFAAANAVAAESGVVAAATLGLVLGDFDLPHEEDIEEFTGDLTTVVLGFVFVAVASLIDFGNVRALGLAGALVVVVVTLVIRPLLVFLSMRNPRFTRNERLFMSAVAPRGIIPASIATLFALELEATGASATAELLAGTVFLIIFVTVVLQAGLAGRIASYLNVEPMRTIIVGAGRVGCALATRLEQDGENVVLVEHDEETVAETRADGFRVRHGDGTNADVLRDAGADTAETIVAATGDDQANLLVCQTANAKFEVRTVAAVVNDPANLQAFEALDVEAIDAGVAAAHSLENVLERPALSKWLNEIGRSGDVREVRVTASDLVGRTVSEVNKMLPEACQVALVANERGEAHVPTGDHEIEAGDSLTIIGERKAVDTAVKRIRPHG